MSENATKQWTVVNDRYSRDELPCTVEQLYEMCDDIGWPRPELTRRGDEYIDQNGEVVLRKQ